MIGIVFKTLFKKKTFSISFKLNQCHGVLYYGLLSTIRFCCLYNILYYYHLILCIIVNYNMLPLTLFLLCNTEHMY
ncbi:hypothetical protein YC2023_043710 [Brassica napus]